VSRDPLEQYFRQISRSMDRLSKRITKLEDQQRFTRATDWMQANWWGRVSPTQPVSKFLQVRGGVLWTWDSAAGTGSFRSLDDASMYDFSTTLVWAQQYYYRWAVLQADMSGLAVARLRLHQDANEWATYVQAENDFWNNGPADDLWGTYIPLCVVVLRNDGYTGVAGAIENITVSDKEQSYILIRDFRPWIHLHE
jgi:hypothetical protein